jgi:phosphoribosyl 1,2-cyclic phosphate phosphodiesterase
MGRRTLTFLGTGTSVGVPMLGCDCPVCRSDDPRNHRWRASVLIGTSEGNILIDTGPEMRLQLLREKVGIVHAVLYTHFHVDHLYGMDDLRLIARYLNGPVPVYCTNEVEDVIRQVFSYAFEYDGEHPGFVPKLQFRPISENCFFEVLGEQVTPIPLKHDYFNVLGFRFGDLAYCTDVSEIPPISWKLLEGVRILILDCLRFKPHPAHLSLEQALEVARKLRPEMTYLTHMSHEFDYQRHNAMLPAGVQMAYDGLKIEF